MIRGITETPQFRAFQVRVQRALPAQLPLPGRPHALPHDRRAFTRTFAILELGPWNGGQIQTEIKSVEQRAGQPAAILIDVRGRAMADAPLAAGEAAGTSPRCLFAERISRRNADQPDIRPSAPRWPTTCANGFSTSESIKRRPPSGSGSARQVWPIGCTNARRLLSVIGRVSFDSCDTTRVPRPMGSGLD